MFLGPGYVMLMVWAVAANTHVLEYNIVFAPGQLEFNIGPDDILVNRLNAIPVVPRPAGFQRPGGFRRPTTTPRPFRKRPTTPRPQPLPVVRPQTRPPQVLPVIRPQPLRPQVQVQQATIRPSRPLPDTPINLNSPEKPQFPGVEPETTTQPPPVLVGQTPSSTFLDRPPSNPNIQTQRPTSFVPSILPNQGVPSVPSSITVSDASVPQSPVFVADLTSFPEANMPQKPPITDTSMLERPPTVATGPGSLPFPQVAPEQPSFTGPNSPQNASFVDMNIERPPPPAPSQPQTQYPFEGPDLPPQPPRPPAFSSSSSNTGAGAGQRPQRPLQFPIIRPPVPSITARPPFRPRPGLAQKPTNAQPPFDSGPHVPPKPPPVPATSTTSFGVNPTRPGDKPQRPLPPSRPILLNPLPLPKPPYTLTTTEKPAYIFTNSSMTDEGNYTFDFLVSNSVYRKEQGFLKKSLVYPGHLIHVKTGAYSFTSPEGTFHRVDFVADERGYRAFESTY